MVWYLDTVHRGPFVAWAYLLPSCSVVVDWVVAYPTSFQPVGAFLVVVAAVGHLLDVLSAALGLTGCWDPKTSPHLIEAWIKYREQCHR